MGVDNVTLTNCFDFYHEDEVTRLWGRLFSCTYDGEFKLDPDEVESGKFMTVQVRLSHVDTKAHDIYTLLLAF